MKISSYANTNEPNLYQHCLPVKTHDSTVDLNIVFEDTDQAGNTLTRGTVIMTHGSPGSHKDFKYITPQLTKFGIRSIGVNWPGLGYSSNDKRLQHTNDERGQLVQGLVDTLELRQNLVFMGHSRGSEDALRRAAFNKDKTAAVVLVNPIGFSHHKGVRPFWSIQVVSWIWKSSAIFQKILAPLLYLRRDVAGNCLMTMSNTDFGKQKEFIKQLQQGDTSAVIVYSGKDHLVEPEKSQELVSYFDDIKQLTCTTELDDANIIEEAKKELNAGRRYLSVFSKRKSFLQKHRAVFLAEIISTIYRIKVECEY
uniref:Serine aminopeptidase S33 domain-containing protein n=1 Tax=Ditylenchus dipsaci TaxID=166011 RepID=A0A915E8J8_9BILA